MNETERQRLLQATRARCARQRNLRIQSTPALRAKATAATYVAHIESQYGEWSEAFVLLQMLERQIKLIEPDPYVRAKERGYYDNNREKERERNRRRRAKRAEA